MKRILAVVLAIVMMFSLVACGGESKDEAKAEKYCWNCGEGIASNATFCEHCGTEINNTSSQENVSNDQGANKPSSATQTTSQPTVTSKPATTTHKHSYSKKVTAATCTAKGYTTYTCSCGHTYKDNYTNPAHNYSNYKCTKCGAVDKSHAYEYLVAYVKENGTTSGGYTRMYAVNGDIVYNLCYSAQHDNLTVQIVFDYEEVSVFSAIYLDNFDYGSSVGEITLLGNIKPSTFTNNSAISYTSYTGNKEVLYDMLEWARRSLCYLVEWLDGYLKDENIGITIADLGFKAYKVSN